VTLEADRLTAAHWLLLRLAGSASDELVAQCRRWLRQRRVLDVGRAVTYAVLSQRIRLFDRDVDLLAELLAADGRDNSGLAMADVVDTDPMPRYGFAPTGRLADADTSAAADTKPRRLMPYPPPEDDADRVLIAAVAADPAIRALWRAWRYPGDRAPWPPARRVWVVETDAGADLVDITGALQEAAGAVGEVYPQVEVYPIGARVPNYQRLARDFGALMWARDPDPGIRVASVMPVDRGLARLSGAEAADVVAYLRGGEALHLAAARTRDAVDPGRGETVPLTVRTDGFWLWCEASAYYLEQHGLAPEARLLGHIRGRGYVVPTVDGAARYRALAVFERDSPYAQFLA
jgi:hypothetical protein